MNGTKNLIYTLDSYKQLHDLMMPEGTEVVYEYGEARSGGEYDYNIFFGLQYILKKWLVGEAISKEMVDEAAPDMADHFKYCGPLWTREKWDYIIKTHKGRLPVSIKALPEGTRIANSNALFTITNTDPKCFWLPGALEDVLQQVWYPTTVATRSHSIVSYIREQFLKTVDDNQQFLADFYLHDFGMRACTCMEQAGIGGLSHLVNSKGTDTCMVYPYAKEFYNAKREDLCHSVPASEHSIATALGRSREFDVTRKLIKTFPNGILSVVSDSYDIANAIKVYCGDLKEEILSRNGKFVIRPDSPRFEGDKPYEQILWIAKELEKSFGTTKNSKDFKVLNDKVGIIYGDGLSETDIKTSILWLVKNGFAASTCVFGQGGGLLQKLNRDTCRFAVKSSAQKRNGEWFDIYKDPKDSTKASKKGQLKVVDMGFDGLTTVNSSSEAYNRKDELIEVFRNGELLVDENFDTIRERARK